MCAGGSKMALLGPKMAKHGRLTDVPKWSKMVQIGQIDQYNMFLTIWDNFGPIWILFDLFKQNLIFCSEHFGHEALCAFEAKNRTSYEKVRNNANRRKMVPNGQNHVILIILDPLRPLWDVGKPAVFGPLLTRLKDGSGQNCFKPTWYMSKDHACATDPQSKHISGRYNQNSARKRSKMAKNCKILAKIVL